MTRKRFEKLLMGRGWSRDNAKDLTAFLKWMRKIGFASPESYAELYQRLIVEGGLKIKRSC